jgi:hypothetical protein
MIHTAEIQKQITSTEYWNIINSLEGIQDLSRQGSYFISYKTSYYRRTGITSIKFFAPTFEVLNKIDNKYVNTFQASYIIIRINLPKILCKGNSSLYHWNDFKLLETLFNDLIQVISPKLPLFNEWQVKRIDYCINYKCNSQDDVQRYLELFKRYTKPQYMKEKEDKQGNKFSSIAYKTGTYDINFYNRKAERIDKKNNYGHTDITDEDIKQAEGILRLEVQCKRDKIKKLADKYELNDLSIKGFLEAMTDERYNEIPKDVFENIYTKVCGIGDYYKLSELSKQRKFSKDTINYSLFNYIARNTDFKTAESHYKQKYFIKKTTFDNFLKRIKIDNINPITIPAKQPLFKGVKFLPNPYNNIEKLVYATDEMNIEDEEINIKDI